MRKGKDPTRETRASNGTIARTSSYLPRGKIRRFLGEVKDSVKDGVNKFRSSRSKDSNSHCPAPLDEHASSATNIEVAPSGAEVEADTPSALHDAQQAVRRMHPPSGPAITARQDFSYSSRFWTSHVRSTVFDHERLFFWFESLALINALSGAVGDLPLIPRWLKDHPELTDLSSPAMDAQRSIQVFGGMILHSTRVKSGCDINWPAVQAMLKGHTSWVSPVSFSPDGTRIVTGSQDNTVRLWDAGTGQPVGEPLRGHTSNFTSVSFSPDGTRIVTGSQDNFDRLWDTPATQPSQRCAAAHPAYSNGDHIMHPDESTTTITTTLNNHFIHFSSNSIHTPCNTSKSTEGASYDDCSLIPFLLNRDNGWMPWHCISDTQRMSRV